MDDASVDGTTQVLREYVESRQVKVMVSVVHMSFSRVLRVR